MTIDIQPPGFNQKGQPTHSFKKIEIERTVAGESAWPLYDSPLSSYDESFKNVAPKGGIKRILKELSKENGNRKLSALDVAGQGTPFIECTEFINHITASTLGDYRNPARKEFEDALGLEYEFGDIFDQEVRDKIARKKYNLVSFRAGGGRYIASSTEKGMDLLSFMYQVLDENGVILMEVPENIPIQLGTGWVNDLGKTHGLEVNFSSPKRDRPSYLLLRKLKGGPKEIRSILDQSPKTPEHAFRINTLTWK